MSKSADECWAEYVNSEACPPWLKKAAEDGGSFAERGMFGQGFLYGQRETYRELKPDIDAIAETAEKLKT